MLYYTVTNKEPILYINTVFNIAWYTCTWTEVDDNRNVVCSEVFVCFVCDNVISVV